MGLPPYHHPRVRKVYGDESTMYEVTLTASGEPTMVVERRIVWVAGSERKLNTMMNAKIARIIATAKESK